MEPRETLSQQMLGKIGDVSRNGAPPGGVHVNLAQPETPAAAPTTSGGGLSTLTASAPLLVLAGAFVWMNARDRKKK